jgi:hypothetical protein
MEASVPLLVAEGITTISRGQMRVSTYNQDSVNENGLTSGKTWLENMEVKRLICLKAICT